jgi:hypothetical protein
MGWTIINAREESNEVFKSLHGPIMQLIGESNE